MKYLFNIFFLLLVFKALLPAQVTDQSWKVYDDTQVAQIFITMNPADYTWMMANPHSDSAHVSTIKFKNKYIDTTITNVGIRIRGNTSRDAQKKSLKISFNEFVKGKDFYGVEKLNVNGEHNDPSIIRSKLCWGLFQKNGFRSSRAAHAAVYINGNYNGLYISVEHIDEEFIKKNFTDATGNLWKCLYPADLTYKGSDPNIYKYRQSFPAYELSTNEDQGDYSQLARLINLINNTPGSAFQDSLENILDVRDFLKYEAMNVLVGQWDDYWSNMNNYYLYFEPTEKKFHFIPYDYDNTFGIDWFSIDWTQADPFNFPKINRGSRPLADKLMAIAQYRDLYTHFLKFIIENTFQYHQMDPAIGRIKEMITPYAQTDTYRTRDYQFTMDDFNNSYNVTPYSKFHVKKGIRQYINERNAYLQNRLNYIGSSPIVYQIDFKPKNLGPNDSIYVYASGFGSAGLDQLNIQFHPGVLTVIYTYQMKARPIIGTTKVEEADQWIGVIPPLGKNGYGRFKIEIKDKNGTSMIYPRTNFVEVKSMSFAGGNSVVVNEFMAKNNSTIKAPNNKYEDWVELFNPTTSDITLTGMYMTDTKINPRQWKFTQPNLVIKPNEHLLIWCDNDLAGQGIHTNFKLAQEGEFIGIVANDGITWIDSLSFGQQASDVSYGRIPDGNIKWGIMTPTPGNANVLTDVKDESIPTEFKVSIYPNPFNPSTSIQYSLPNASDVTIKIYDLLGKEIWSQEQTLQIPGLHTILWNGVNNNGSLVSSGIYLCRISTQKFNITKKLVLMK